MPAPIILAMPSSGSDLLAECVSKELSLSYFKKEFYNPITNLLMHDELIRGGFACETHRGISNIGMPLNNLGNQTLAGHKDKFGLYKEVFWMGKIDSYLRFFNPIILVRSKKSLFPPSRLRVLQWYDCFSDNRNAPFLENVEQGFDNLLNYCKEVSEKHNIPIVSHDELLSDGDTTAREELKKWIGSYKVEEILERFQKNYKRSDKENITFPIVYCEKQKRLRIKGA